MKRSVRGAAIPALIVLTVGGLAAPAKAEPDPADVRLYWATASCGQVKDSDATVAAQLSRVVTGRMKTRTTAYSMSCARMVVKAVQDRGLPKRAAVIAITTTIVESFIQNVSETVDHDSLGLFQQRAPWGSAKNRLDPVWATNAFLNKMISKYPNNKWKTEPIGEVCQKVQVSAHPSRYQEEVGDAQKIVDALWVEPSLFGADFDGDGVGDLFATGTGTLHIWNGRGGNKFTGADPVGAGWNGYTRPVGGDFDGDGIGDLAAVRDDTLYVWNGKGGNRFTSPAKVGAGWAGMATSLMSLGDVNKDGRADIGAVGTDGVLRVWNGKGNNKFTPVDKVGPGWNAYRRPVGGDFNADGIGDLAAADKDGVLHIWNGKGGNRFGAAQRVGTGWTRFARTLMSPGDVDKDGHGDLAAIDGDGVLHIWNGKGGNKFTPADPIGGGWARHYPSKFGTDLNVDGIGDLFATGTGTLNVWNGKGNNKFTPADQVGPGWSEVSRPVGGDFDGDGIGDLVGVKGGKLLIWNGKGGNRFTSAVEVGPGWTASHAATLASPGDVDKDGHADLAAVDKDGVLHLWNGRANNKFGPAVRVGSGWTKFSRPVGGDFDNDDIGDLAAVDKDGALHIWNGKGNNKFTPAAKIGTGWTDLARTLMSPGDVDKDGHADLAAVDKDGVLNLWNGKGGNKFGPAVKVGPGWNPHFPG